MLFCNYSADKLICSEHIVGLHPGAAESDANGCFHQQLHRGAVLH